MLPLLHRIVPYVYIRECTNQRTIRAKNFTTRVSVSRYRVSVLRRASRPSNFTADVDGLILRCRPWRSSVLAASGAHSSTRAACSAQHGVPEELQRPTESWTPQPKQHGVKGSRQEDIRSALLVCRRRRRRRQQRPVVHGHRRQRQCRRRSDAASRTPMPRTGSAHSILDSLVFDDGDGVVPVCQGRPGDRPAGVVLHGPNGGGRVGIPVQALPAADAEAEGVREGPGGGAAQLVAGAAAKVRRDAEAAAAGRPGAERAAAHGEREEAQGRGRVHLRG
jgi:hypothetical protein